ncbi:flagellar hook-length control protein FliK [Brevundimonas sp.]|uniref:flagellar hook-length control protein FliK n=1 Tax=Brevundimonas sp. TaxID=1871086 RepID=UPI00289E436D|nr:flagellar hook-length control protein FliK [Brevundimonas sp.]
MSASAILSVLPLGAPKGAAGFGASANSAGTDNATDNAFAGLLGAVMDSETPTTKEAVAKDTVSNGDNVTAFAFAAPPPPILPVPPIEAAPVEAPADTDENNDAAETEFTTAGPSLLPDSEMLETPAREPEAGLPIITAPLSSLAMAPVDAAPEPVPPAPATRLNLNPEVPLAAQLRTDDTATAPDAEQTEIPAPATSAQDAEAASRQRAQQVEATLRQTQNPQLLATTAAQALQVAPKTTGEFKSNAAAHRLDKGGNALTADMSAEMAATTTTTGGNQPSTMAASMAEGASASFTAEQTSTVRTAPAPLLPADAAPEAQAAMSEPLQGATGTDTAVATRLDLTRLSAANFNTTAEIAAQFVQKLGQRVARFDMVLTPETLGTVEIAMEVGADGDVKARMVFDTPAAANELRARAEELRRQLNEAGFQISENALEFTDRESDQRGGFQQFMSDGRSGRRAFAGSSRLAEQADAPPPVWQSLNLAPTGVDMKV